MQRRCIKKPPAETDGEHDLRILGESADLVCINVQHFEKCFNLYTLDKMIRMLTKSENNKIFTECFGKKLFIYRTIFIFYRKLLTQLTSESCQILLRTSRSI